MSWRSSRNLGSLSLLVLAPLASLGHPLSPLVQEPDTGAGVILARVGGRVITADAFRAEMDRRARLGSGSFRSPDQRAALLEELVNQAAVASAAAASGYDKDAEVLAALDRILTDRYLHDRTAAAARPTDAEVVRYYDAHAADFGGGERRRGGFIRIGLARTASAETKQAAEARARRAAADARGAEANAFAMAADRYSDDAATRYIGGDMGWVREGDTGYRWDPAVTAALFKITTVGGVAGPVATPEGLFVVRLIEKTDGKPRPLAAVRSNIEQRLLQERRARLEQEAYAEARRAIPVNIDRAALLAITPPAPSEITADEPPPPLPGSNPPPPKPKGSPEPAR